MDKIQVAEWFRAKSPSLARCEEGDLPLLNFFNLTCMILYAEIFSPPFYFRPLNDLAFRLEGEFKTWLIKSYIKDCVRNRVDEFKAR